MTDKDMKSLGQIGWEAYTASTNGVSAVTGDPLPEWEVLVHISPTAVAAWEAVGKAIRTTVMEDFGIIPALHEGMPLEEAAQLMIENAEGKKELTPVDGLTNYMMRLDAMTVASRFLAGRATDPEHLFLVTNLVQQNLRTP